MAIERVAFTQAFSTLVFQSWTSEEYQNKLTQTPHAAMAAVGLAVPADATITLRTEKAAGQHNVDEHLARWEEGERTGIYQFVLAERPDDLEDMPLADESLLEIVGGVENNCCCATCCTVVYL